MEVRDLVSCSKGERPERDPFVCHRQFLSSSRPGWRTDPKRRNRLHWGTAQKEGMDGWDESKRRISKRGTNSSIESGFFTESRAVAFDIRFKMDLEGPFTQNEAKGEDQVQILEARENTR